MALKTSMYALNMEMELAALSRDTPLSPFGKMARWLFVAGLYLHLTNTGNEQGVTEITPLMDRAYNSIEQGIFKVYRVPSWLWEAKTAYHYLPTKYAEFNKWFLAHIRDHEDISLDEKDLFRKGIYLVKTAETKQIPSTARDSIGLISRVLSDKLGTLFINYFTKKKGTAAEFEGKKGVENIYLELEILVKTLTNKKGTYIPPKEIKELKLTSEDQVVALEKYKQARKRLKTFSDATLYTLLSSGPADVDKAEKEMRNHGFRDMPFVTKGDGYKGKIGLDGKGKLAYFTQGGRLLYGMIAPNSKVKMNPKYNEELDDSFYLSFRAPNAVADSRIYSTSFKNVKTEEKHTKTTTNAGNVAQWVKAWERDIFVKDPMRYVPAAVAMILYLTSARIGTSKENRSLKGGAHTYGISTLRRKHVKLTTASIIFDYIGKKGMKQRHVLKLNDKVNKRLGVILSRLVKDKSPDDLVFSFVRPTSRAGAIQEVNPTFFRQYLKSVGVTINPHALRHIRGTELARELLASSAWSPSTKAKTLAAKQKEAETFIKDKILTKVAQLLGHFTTKDGKQIEAWRTSIQSYINPVLISDWFKEKRLAVPKWCPTKLDLT